MAFPLRLFRFGVLTSVPLLISPFALAVQVSSEELPASIAAPGEIPVLTAHAEGAQIYECHVDESGKLAWALREPVATLLVEGATVGRHYAGPNWEYHDGSAINGKQVGSASGRTPADIPWLKVDVIARRGSGMLSQVVTVQRIHTQGGTIDGACEIEGSYRGAAYSADYVFLRKADGTTAR